jgi:hypothetical protein
MYKVCDQSVFTYGVLAEIQQLIVDSFQKYFLSTTEKIISNLNNNEVIEDNSCINYLYRVFNNPFQNTTFEPTKVSEIKKIIKFLKSKNSYGYDEISVKISSSFKLYL